MTESAPRRAFNDSVAALKTVWFGVAAELVLAVAGGTWLVTTAPETASPRELVVRAVLGGLIGFCIAVIVVYSFHFLRAPYRQREEARATNRRDEEKLRMQMTPLARAKKALRERAGQGLLIQAESGSNPTEKEFDGWSNYACETVEKFLGKPDANRFQFDLGAQLIGSPNDFRNGLKTGIDWLNASADKITESDVMP